MPNCQSCGQEWSWGDTFKIGFKYDGKKCPKCGEKQYISKKSRNKTSMISLISIVIIFFSRPFFDLSVATHLLFAIPILVIVTIITLYSIKLSNVQEPLW
ncbi:TIGR04104 family putative zinc finger protein [Paenisporosarcina sp. TG20]|uniref:TIGR04104 family putative zinc finger protein n=1 Tax=Paenisporosarcina sp. TG20 TaxID=1211706 RepID=UPI00038082C4|nr:TIGR04104 family putative zinc finger protein [Paenisporosarcina sp. TG20]